MIHKLFFSFITVFWILGISQGYVLGQDNSTEVEAQFTIRNRLDIDAMMKLAGYENRGDFLSIMEKVTGDYNWDRNVDKGDRFFIPKPIGMVEVEPVDAESEVMEIVEPKPEPEGYNPTYGSTYDRVMDRGYVICGTKANFPGFSEKKFVEFEDRWVGFDADICRAIAVAVFGDVDAIDYVVVDGRTRFEFLIDGTIDVLSAATTYTFSRNVDKRLEFLPTTYYDGQGFIVRRTLDVSSAKQLSGAKICFSGSGTAKNNIKDFFNLHNLDYVPIEVPVDKKPKDLYIDGKCDMYGTDASGLASNRHGFKHPERHVILPEIISKEPLGPVVRYGDQQWSDIVRWTVYVLFLAEELGITSENIEEFKEHKNPTIQRFMGELNGKEDAYLGSKLGLYKEWAADIIRYIGNYEEIYERNVGENTPLRLKRGLNKLYTKGGLLYSPPLK